MSLPNVLEYRQPESRITGDFRIISGNARPLSHGKYTRTKRGPKEYTSAGACGHPNLLSRVDVKIEISVLPVSCQHSGDESKREKNPFLLAVTESHLSDLPPAQNRKQ